MRRGTWTVPALPNSSRNLTSWCFRHIIRKGFRRWFLRPWGPDCLSSRLDRWGTADWLEPDIHAVFTPARDPHALAEAIVRLAADVDLRRRMSAANLERIREFEPVRSGRTVRERRCRPFWILPKVTLDEGIGLEHESRGKPRWFVERRVQPGRSPTGDAPAARRWVRWPHSDVGLLMVIADTARGGQWTRSQRTICPSARASRRNLY